MAACGTGAWPRRRAPIFGSRGHTLSRYPPPHHRSRRACGYAARRNRREWFVRSCGYAPHWRARLSPCTLPEPGLGLEAVAHSQGISPRYLRRLLETSGTSFTRTAAMSISRTSVRPVGAGSIGTTEEVMEVGSVVLSLGAAVSVVVDEASSV